MHSRAREPGHKPLGRTRTTGHAAVVVGRLPWPLACALAVASVPLALHLAAARAAGPLPGSGAAAGPTAGASGVPTPEDISPAPVSGMPTPPSTAPETPGTSPSQRDAGPATAHTPWPTRRTVRATARATGRASAHVSSPPAAAPLDLPPARPAKVSWVLRADRLVLRGARFRGVVRVRTAAGTVRALKFTVRSLDAVGLDLSAGRGRTATRLRAGPTTTSTFGGQGADGVVTLYVRRLSGTLTRLTGGPLPAHRTVTLTPDAVPHWLSHPATPARTITLVAVTVRQAAQFGGRLSVTGPQLRAAAG
ncbi:hypothetical protein [Streptomyces broussonetiae]|uniref:Uncharacterized protein n=1 Tax=Streptomyces broussonetiae TaxID=2686304 RepID=A0A6I6NC62_9ACTN|nr:hypothetical protein [Streptomyces broussonetiae]QHA05876.1 hypothetical protein GQF42_23625 [Streptomyces broussonetiae]